MNTAAESYILERPKDISVIIPMFEEGTGLRAELLKRNAEALQTTLGKHFGDSYELLAVDDGSTDNTAQISADVGLSVIRYDRNRGKGAALRLGMLAVTGEVRAFIDADGSFKPEILLEFYDAIQNGADIAVAQRAGDAEQHASRLRAFGHTALPRILEKIAPTGGIKDVQAGAKAFSREAADLIWPQALCDGYGIDRQILHMAYIHGMDIMEIPTLITPAPNSHVDMFDVFGLAYQAIQAQRQGLSHTASPEQTDELLASYKSYPITARLAA